MKETRTLTKEEFDKLAGVFLSEECFQCLVEPEFISSELTVEEFVENWNKGIGIGRAYNWECAHRQQAEKQSIRKATQLNAVEKEMDKYMAKAERLESEVENLKKEIADLRNDNELLSREEKETAEFLIRKGAENNDESLFGKAIALRGKKAYIEYKLKNNFELNETDKKILISIL